MKEIKQVKKRKKKYKRIKMILMVLLVIVLVCLGVQCTKKEPQPLSKYETQVNAITEIDYSEQQDALNAIVEEGKMNVNYSSEAVFKGSVSEKFNVKNIKNNHHPIVVELYDEAYNCLYQSGKIEPGYEINSIELNKQLEKGTHECKLKVGYAEEGNVSSVFPITIEVK